MKNSVDEQFLHAFENARDAVIFVDEVSGVLLKSNRIAKNWWGNIRQIGDIFDAETLDILRSDRVSSGTRAFAKFGSKSVLSVFSMSFPSEERSNYRMLVVCKPIDTERDRLRNNIESMRSDFSTDFIHRISRNIKNTMQATQLAVEQTGANFYGLSELIKNIQTSLRLAEHMLSVVPNLYSRSCSGDRRNERNDSALSDRGGIVDLGSIVSRIIPLMEFRMGRKVAFEIESTSKGLFTRCKEGSVEFLLFAIADHCRRPIDCNRSSSVRLKVSAVADDIEVAVFDWESNQRGLSGERNRIQARSSNSAKSGLGSHRDESFGGWNPPSIENLARWMANEGGRLVEERGESGVQTYRLKFPNFVRESNVVEKRRRSASFGLPVFLSSRDPNLLLSMRIAARKASFSIESGTAAPVSLFAKMCRYAGWIVDLENSDRATVLPILEKLAQGSAPVPVILVEPSHRSLEPRAWTILDGFSATGAPIIRRPFQAEAIAEQLLNMKAKIEKIRCV